MRFVKIEPVIIISTPKETGPRRPMGLVLTSVLSAID
jgi:hypothetical protein